MRLLLDTHAFVWLASDQSKLPEAAKEAIASSDAVYLSSATPWEIGLLVKRGRLELPLHTSEYVSSAMEQHITDEIPIDRHLAIRATELPEIHNDPFDRVLVATAIGHDLVLVTRDEVIPTYPEVRTLWSTPLTQPRP
jgi:PIN domain nuclease of toxin-antitoxin system